MADELSTLTYTLSQKQLQDVLNYLATRPYAEVFKLVSMIQTVAPNKTVPTLVPSVTDAEEKAQA